MKRRAALILCLASLGLIADAHAQLACQLCSTQPSAAAANGKALKIDINTALDFSTAAHGDTGQGSIEIDPRTGVRRVTGGLVALGGMAIKGTVFLNGEPLRRVRITFPTSVTMHSTQGATADITDFVADVSSDPMLGPDGILSFSFGARLTVRNGAAGDFHGNMQVTAEYQ